VTGIRIIAIKNYNMISGKPKKYWEN